MPTLSLGQRITAGVLILGPALVFVILRLVPAWDPMWGSHVFHFYIVSFTSLMAVVVAIFVLAGIGSSGPQALFVAMAFLAIAGFFFLHGIATPGMLLSDAYDHGVGLSSRLSLTSGALFLFFAVIPGAKGLQRSLAQQRWALASIFGLLYIAYIVIILQSPDVVSTLEQLSAVNLALVLLTLALLALSFWFVWQEYRREQHRLYAALLFALPWLFVTQISQYMAPTWAASWWEYHLLMLASFVITMGALVMDYERVLNFRATRYFIALGVIFGVPVLALLSEATVRLSGSEAARWPMFGFSFLAVLLLFIVSLFVVQRAQAILDERAAALEAEKQWRTDFTNLIVHDLKSPLSVTSVSVSLILSGRVDPISDKQRAMLERAQRGTSDTLDLIDNLLDIEKLEAGSLNLMLTATNLTQLLQNTAESLQTVAEANKLKLESAVPGDLPEVALDTTLCKRVIQNLITNAIKYTPQGGAIRVEAAKMPQAVMVSVIDSGPGVPPDQRERIFEKFVQIQSTERRGVGLGLAFCKLAVEAHGGRIWVEAGPSGGSRFAFTLPLTVKTASGL